jgi:hypothetical protein
MGVGRDRRIVNIMLLVPTTARKRTKSKKTLRGKEEEENIKVYNLLSFV